jgi:Family of unknown function (DUF6176)
MLLLVFNRVKPEKVERLRSWLHELETRREEVLETFHNETTRHEVAYLLEGREGPVLVYAIEAENVDTAREAFQNSTLRIDAEHKAVMAEVLVDCAGVEKLYECASPRASSD